MKTIEKILAQIESCITQNRYESIETDKIELKDLSGGVSAELYKSACAFLNAEGGMIIIGIHEEVSNKGYVLKGYNPEIENALKELPKKFTREDNSPVDLSNSFPTYEIKEFMDSRVCIVYIEKLDEEQKYVFYKGEAYKRKITADHKLTQDEIKAQNELKADLADVRELKTVDNATLDALDVNRLNDYIVRLNRDVNVEGLKADIPSSRSFLIRKAFVRGDTPTLLGMLVCGQNIEDYVGGRCQVDGFVDSPVQIAENKQVLKDNIFGLMDRGVGFIYKNIQVGVSYVKSGTELPEYPERLIRETVNNALAHRDYSIDKFVNIIIRPNENIEIRNPGSFRQEQKLVFNDQTQNIKVRRIIPITKARNPRLADILKTFDRWEGRGIGMASLTNACLDNQIGVPYYVFHSENDISLFIPKGKTLDDKMDLWFKSFSGYILRKLGGKELSEQEKIVLCYFYQSELLNRLERYTILLTSDNNHFKVTVDLEDKGFIFKHPQSPDIHPVYLVDRVLAQTDFTNPLRDLFGKDYDDLKSDYKEVLQVIHQHNQYSLQQTASANSASTFLYLRKNSRITNVPEFDNFKRGIRSIFNKLENRNFIVRSGSKRKDGKLKPEFLLNQSFKRVVPSP